MTTMISPRGHRNSATSFAPHTAPIVPPAATWNGGFERPTTAVRTRSVSSQGRRLTASAAETPRMRKQRYRDSLGQLALGGVLGLTAIIGMLAVDGTNDQDVLQPASVNVATVNAK